MKSREVTHKTTLPNGHVIHFIPTDPANPTEYILEVRDGGVVISSTCSCNGVSINCPPGKSPSCDCTKNPPQLSCV
jgi:hypothetical protein